MVAHLSLALVAVLISSQTAGAVECHGLDQDHCESVKGCVYDNALFSCVDVSCNIYEGNHMCKADPDQYGPCEYDWSVRSDA